MSKPVKPGPKPEPPAGSVEAQAVSKHKAGTIIDMPHEVNPLPVETIAAQACIVPFCPTCGLLMQYVPIGKVRCWTGDCIDRGKSYSAPMQDVPLTPVTGPVRF